MRNVFLLCLSLGAAAFSVGCGVQASSSSSNPETLEAFFKVSNQLTCEASERCCGTTCSTASDATFYKNTTRTIEFINLGLLRYDPAAAAECLAATSQYYSVCDKPEFQATKLPTACSKYVVPNTQAGGMCETAIGNCVPETLCTSGTCIALPAVSQPCAPLGTNPRCVTTAYCETTVMGSVCRALPASGQSCGVSGGQCATGFYCDGTTLLCTANGQSGQACSGTKPCDTKAGLVCLSNSTCGLPQPDGAPCSSNTHCQSVRCSGTIAGSTCQPQLSPITIRHRLCNLR